jgi:transcriptional regulator with XRE-family HTH domain
VNKKTARRTRYRNKALNAALGANCKALRKMRGYSIDRLAKESDGLSPASIHRLENGQVDVQFSVLFRIAKTLELPLKKLVDFDMTEF